MSFYLIAARSSNGVIGRDGTIPWHARGEQRLFRELTLGHTLVMGRKTAESIGRALPGRDTVVVTRQAAFSLVGCRVAGCLEEALALAAELRGDTFIAGGGELYRQLLPRATGVHLTTIARQVQGDVYFPRLPTNEFQRKHQPRSYKTNVRYTYEYFERCNRTGTD